MSDQLANFNARLKRIENPRNTYWTDHETGINIPRRLSKGAIMAHNFAKKRSPMMIVISAALGLICLMAARYVRFQLAEIPDTGTEAMTLTVMDVGIAAMMAFIIGSVVRLKTLGDMMAQMAGIAVMLVAMHNLVWLFPSEFATVYSQAYVDQVRSLTAPQSIYLNGQIITL